MSSKSHSQCKPRMKPGNGAFVAILIIANFIEHLLCARLIVFTCVNPFNPQGYL